MIQYMYFDKKQKEANRKKTMTIGVMFWWL